MIEDYFKSVNWPTAITIFVAIIPVIVGMYKLIAAHDARALKAEREAHKDTGEQLNKSEGRFLRMKAEGDRLKAENAELVNINEAFNKKGEVEESGELHELEMSILTLLAATDGEKLTAEQVSSMIKENVTRTTHYIRKLEDRSFISNSLNMGQGIRYFLADKGRAYLVEHGLV